MARVPAKSGKAAKSSRGLDDRLAAVRKTTSLDELRDALRSTSGLLVAVAAARIAAEALPRALLEEFPAAFARLADLDSAAKRDPGCRGKLALAQALYDLDAWDDLFELGARYKQFEPEWGGSRDTAGDLRGLCGLAHAHFIRGDAMDVLADLLADPERSARAAAAQALGNAGRPDATALLRFKLLTGDPEPAVLSACFESLLGMARDAAVPFCRRFLVAHDEPAEVAVLALGASRLESAFPLVEAWSARALSEQRQRVGYLALALLRREPATELLLDVIATGDYRDALAAAVALATFKEDRGLRDRVLAAAATRRDRASVEIERAF